MNNDVSILQPRTLTFGGLTVRRYLPSRKIKSVGPWLFLDHIGPGSFPPGKGVDVIPHPHINLSTVTYLFHGDLVHRDTLGSIQTITPGAVNLMKAGRGIAHSERTGPDTRAAGHNLHGIQLWAGMTEDTEEDEPAFTHYPEAALPTSIVDGASVRVMMGRAFGLTSPVTYAAQILYAEVAVSAGSSFDIDFDEDEAAILPVSGDIQVGGQAVPEHSLVVLSGATQVRSDGGCRFAIIGGAPLGRRYMWWNFVSSSRDRIEQAKQDWKRHQFGEVVDDAEYTPLPESDTFSDMKE